MKAVAEAYHCGSITLCFHNCWSHSPFVTLISIWSFRRPLGPPSPESPQDCYLCSQSLTCISCILDMEVKDSMDRFLQQVFPVHPHYSFDFSRFVHTAPSITGTHKPLQHSKRGFDPYKWILTVAFFSGDTIMNHFNQPGSHRIHPGTAPWNIQACPGKWFRVQILQ